ncbi:MAG: nitroreductase family protein [Clostridia bacterium]|nr:nitroreductase family protein [Clostridia bacterium]
MEFSDLALQRRSVRAYEDKPVDPALIEQILQAAQLAPTWKNSQTGRYYVAATPEAQAKIRACLPSFNQRSSDHAALIVTAYVKDVSGFTAGQPDNELGNQWGAYDLGLQNAYLVLKARELGLDTLIMGIRDEAALRAAAGIPDTEAVFSVIALGYRAQEPSLRPRKALSDVTRFL